MSTPPTQPHAPDEEAETLLAITPRPKSDHYAIKLHFNHRDPRSSTSADDCLCYHDVEIVTLCLIGPMPRPAEHLNQSIIAVQLHQYAEHHASIMHSFEFNTRRNMFLQHGINHHFRTIKVGNGNVCWSGGDVRPSLFDFSLEEAEIALRGDGAFVCMYVVVDWWFVPLEEIEKSISDQNQEVWDARRLRY